jgi:hypothetical protein
MPHAVRWQVYDRYGNSIYLTQERWEHIIDPLNHPEFVGQEEKLKETIQQGARKQDSLNPQKYRYTKAFDTLPMDNTHIVVIVLYRYRAEAGQPTPNNFVVTAYQVEKD